MANKVWNDEKSVQLCISAVESSVKELLVTADSMRAGLERLTGICSGPQFEALKPEVAKEVAALHIQVAALKSKAIPELQRIEDWIKKGNRLRF